MAANVPRGTLSMPGRGGDGEGRDLGRHVQLGEPLGHETFDLFPAPVRGGRQQLRGVPGRQVLGEDDEPAQVDAARGQGFEDAGDLAAGARDPDSLLRGLLGEAQFP